MACRVVKNKKVALKRNGRLKKGYRYGKGGRVLKCS